ncbi:MAG: histone deacetylase [Gammaproteobacteria bacterium]|nr:histone deacetylase [Gammaproteobacteria bacterium]
MLSHLIYTKDYDISFWGLNRFHPFDGWKFSKAWHIVNKAFRGKAQNLLLNPSTPVSNELLLAIHSPAYLSALQQSATVSQIMEIKLIQYLPNYLLQRKLLHPMRMACAGTVLAAETALHNKSVAMNFAGGYHHAYPDHGDGFCFFGDAALSITNCRQKGLLQPHDKILMIDLDAHRGNGFYAFMGKDPDVHIFDMYNFQTYPGYFEDSANQHPYIIPLKAGTRDEQYLDILSSLLPKFLDEHKDAKLVFYNAGNDIFENDRLGKLSVSYHGVLRRDCIVLEELTNRLMPSVIMTSGGYTRTSYQFIAELAKSVIKLTNY